MSAGRESAVRIGLLYPELLGTYGDSGNATVLAQRLRRRGIGADVVSVESREPVPAGCDVYLLGGAEDAAQRHVARALAEGGVFAGVVDRGAAVLAVCAGLQVLGESFEVSDGTTMSGAAVLDLRTRRPVDPRRTPRAVGEAVVQPRADLGLPVVVGFENHGGLTSLGPSAQPLGTALAGIGNGGEPGGSEGIATGRILGTYLHGPVLALNPALADLLLSYVVGSLEPIDDSAAERARAHRLAMAAGHSRRRRFSRFSRSAAR
ncbi:MAG: glutamine amidotransferase [Actinomycetota bacterium]|nr:glutamine amidotransferase [Actinomycetota bacterium]